MNEFDSTLTASPDAPKRPETEQPAAQLPRIEPETYEVGQEVARGGMGRIVAARDRRLGRTVAIKELHEGAKGFAVRFEREALITARLQHPGIVPVYEAGHWPDGEPFYAMRLVQGRSLKEALQAAQTPAERLALLPSVLASAQALAYAHGERVIHRDLKPANILVGRFGETVVIDWGLAKDLAVAEPRAVSMAPAASPSSSPDLTMAGSVMGTPAYMPPEQAAGEAVDERADVYALGAILYHVLAGHAPYAEEKTPDRLLAAATVRPPRPLAEVAPDLPLDLIAIVDKAMAREPEDRYPSAAELADELARYQAGQLVASHHYTKWQLIVRWVKKWRESVTIASLSLILLGVGLADAFRRVVRERDAALAARRAEETRAEESTLGQARAELDRDPMRAMKLLASLRPDSPLLPAARVIAADAWSRGVSVVLKGHKQPITRFAATRRGRLASADEGGTIRVWDADGRLVNVLEHGGTIFDIALSSDGERLASVGAGGQVKLWSLPGGTLREFSGHAGPIMAADWSPDGKLLATAGFDGTVRLWRPDESSAREISRQAGYAEVVEFSPDGSRLLAGGNEQPLRLWRVSDGAPLGEVAPARTVEGAHFSPDGKRVVLFGYDRSIAVWRGEAELRRLALENNPVDARFSPDSRSLAVLDQSGSVLLWDVLAGTTRVLAPARGLRAGGVLAFSPDGLNLVAGYEDGQIDVWEVKGGEPRRFASHDGRISGLAFVERQGPLLVSASRDRTLRLWPLWAASGEPLSHDLGTPLALDLSDDGRTVVAGGMGNSMWFWDTGSSRGGALRSPDGWLQGLDLAPDGRHLASLSMDKRLRLWRLADRSSRLLTCLAADAPQFSPDGGYLVAISADAPGVCLTEVASGEERFVPTSRRVRRPRWADDSRRLAVLDDSGPLVVHVDGRIDRGPLPGVEVLDLAFSPDGQRLALAGADGVARVVELAGGRTRELGNHAGGVRALAFSPDGSELVVAGADRTVTRWDVLTGWERGPTRRLRHPPRSVRWAQSGALFVVEEERGAIAWFDAATGELRELLGHRGELIGARVAPDGRLVASAAWDGSVRLWRDPLRPRDLGVAVESLLALISRATR